MAGLDEYTRSKLGIEILITQRAKLGIRMLIRERCPRCKGTMMMEPDPELNCYRSCLNCGYVSYVGDLVLQ